MFSDKPEMMSGGLGFTNIIGLSDTTDEQIVRAAGGAWNSGLTCRQEKRAPWALATAPGSTPAAAEQLAGGGWDGETSGEA